MNHMGCVEININGVQWSGTGVSTSGGENENSWTRETGKTLPMANSRFIDFLNMYYLYRVSHK